jgi:hypothetical protein
VNLAVLGRVHALTRDVVVAAAATIAALVLLACLGALVRTLPWLLASEVPLTAMTPLVRNLFVIALEASFYFGLPLGAAVGTARWIERGEARVFALLGEPPSRTARAVLVGLVPGLAVLACLAYQSGRGAARPGEFVGELLERTSKECSKSSIRTAAVPMVGVTWLCWPNAAPELVGRAPVGNVWFSAKSLHFSGDLRDANVAHARFLFAKVDVTADQVELRGLPSVLPASGVAPRVRMWCLGLSACVCVWLLVYVQLRQRVRGSLTAVAAAGCAIAGSATGLLLYRHLETRQRPAVYWLGVPLLAAAVTFCAVYALSNLRRQRRADTP